MSWNYVILSNHIFGGCSHRKVLAAKSADVFGFDMKKTAPHRAALDNFISGGYTKHRKGAAGRRLTRRYYLEK